MDKNALYKKYKSIMEKITNEPPLADENGKITRLGERLIAISARYWPSAFLEVIKGIGPVAHTFLYNFGKVCGEAIASRYIEMGVPKEKVVEYVLAGGWYFGWCLGYVAKQDFENKIIETVMLENFEADYGKGCHFMRGVHAGVWKRVVEDEVYCEEVECKGRGGKVCRFVVKPSSKVILDGRVV